MRPQFSHGPAIHFGPASQAWPQYGQSTMASESIPWSASEIMATSLRRPPALAFRIPMLEGDPFHQFQMLLKPLEKALRSEDVEVAMRFAGHLFAVGSGPADYQDRKVHVLLRAMEGATPSVKTAFTARLLEAYGAKLSEDSRQRLAGRLERL